MKKPVLLDGAVGTSLWEMAEANGVEKVPVWRYNLEHPEFVRALCERYVDAGAQIILANTFGANGPSVRRASEYKAAEVVAAGVRIAKEALALPINAKDILRASVFSSMLKQVFRNLEGGTEQ